MAFSIDLEAIEQENLRELRTKLIQTGHRQGSEIISNGHCGYHQLIHVPTGSYVGATLTHEQDMNEEFVKKAYGEMEKLLKETVIRSFSHKIT